MAPEHQYVEEVDEVTPSRALTKTCFNCRKDKPIESFGRGYLKCGECRQKEDDGRSGWRQGGPVVQGSAPLPAVRLPHFTRTNTYEKTEQLAHELNDYIAAVLNAAAEGRMRHVEAAGRLLRLTAGIREGVQR